MNLLDLTYVIHLVRTFTTFVTLWEDNNPFKNLFALYIKHIKTYYHLCKEIQDNLGFWIPAFSWNLDSGLLGLYSGFQSPGFQIPQAKFSRIPEFPDSLTCSDYSVWPAKAKVLRGILLKIKQERSSRHRMKSERLVQTDELGGEGHNVKKTWSLILALAPTDNYKLRF